MNRPSKVEAGGGARSERRELRFLCLATIVQQQYVSVYFVAFPEISGGQSKADRVQSGHTAVGTAACRVVILLLCVIRYDIIQPFFGGGAAGACCSRCRTVSAISHVFVNNTVLYLKIEHEPSLKCCSLTNSAEGC